MRSFLWNIPVNLFYIFVQSFLVNIHRKLDVLGKCTDIDLRVSAISKAIRPSEHLTKCLHESCFYMGHIIVT